MSWINSNATYKQNSKNDLSFYHGFSKTPVEPTSTGTAATTLANASTKGGHTVIGTEVWAEEIPWFGLVPSRAVAVTRLSGLTKLNDLVKVDGEGGKVYKYIGADDTTFTEAQWSSFWQEVTLTNGMTLNNRRNQPVLRYYLNQPMQTLTTTNNASIDSKGYATRLFVNEETHVGQTSGGSVVSQFAAGTDNIKNGIPSVELNPKLYLGTTEKIAGTHYYDYNVSGTILWNANVASSSPKISCFRYIGKTVTSQLATIISDATLTSGDNAIQSATDDAVNKLVTAAQVKEYVDENAKQPVDDLSVVVSGISQIINDIQDTVDDITIPDVTTSSAAQNVGVTASGHEVSVATATYTPASGDVNASWTNPGHLITGTTVEAFVSAETTKTLDAANAFSQSLHTTSVTYYVTDTLPTVPSGKEEDYKGRIYLVLTGKDGAVAADGSRIEYMYVQKNDVWDWEQIGTTTADLSGYAKTAELNVLETAANGLTYSQTNGVISASVDRASISKVGTVLLTNTYTSNDEDKAATGKAIADAIATLDVSNVGEGAVKVSQADGKVTSVTVATETLVDNNALKTEVTDPDALITANDAFEAIKLAKPENYISTVSDGKTDIEGNYVNETSGETKLVIKDGRTTIYPNDLWGTTVSMVGDTITVQGGPIDGTAWAAKNGYNTITKVENNIVYNETTEVANIKTNELVNGSRMFYSTSLTSFSGDLSSLVNGSSMFYSTSLTSFNGDLNSLVNGSRMFYSTSLTSFSGDLSSLVNGSSMFFNTSLTLFNGDLSSLVDGSEMFNNTSLTSFSGDLSSLVNGSEMFFNTSLTSFNGDLNSLVDGSNMFNSTSLTSFNGDLSSLVYGNSMFFNTSLESFNGDLSSLVDGYNMFLGTPLESFNGDLSSLVTGSDMFNDTSLDIESVELICGVLPNYNTKNRGTQLQTTTWNESEGKYTYSDWESGDYNYPIVKIESVSDAMSQGNTDGIRRVFGTESISESDVKTITIKWKSGSAILGEGHEADRTEIAELFTNTATEKGWTFLVNTEIAESGEIAPPNAVMATDGTIQYYILAKKDEATEDNATHIDASGKLWKFDTAEAIIGPNIKYWSIFATVEDALTEWELTPIVK